MRFYMSQQVFDLLAVSERRRLCNDTEVLCVEVGLAKHNPIIVVVLGDELTLDQFSELFDEEVREILSEAVLARLEAASPDVLGSSNLEPKPAG